MQMNGRTAEFTLPLPPSVNNAYTGGADGRRHLTKDCRQWKTAASVTIRDACRAAGFKPCAGQYRLTILLSDCGLIRDRDCDNTLKLLLDAIVKSGMVANDHHRHLRAVSVEWTDRIPEGMCAVSLTELAGEAKAKPGVSLNPKTPNGLPEAVLAGLRARGIKVDPKRVHVQ